MNHFGCTLIGISRILPNGYVVFFGFHGIIMSNDLCSCKNAYSERLKKAENNYRILILVDIEREISAIYSLSQSRHFNHMYFVLTAFHKKNMKFSRNNFYPG